MSGYDPRFIEKLKDKNDIVSVVSSYVRLEKRGNTFWACCPFHHEKTPSFTVNEREQFYYCFGCKKSGDVINFVMERESIDFADAVKLLAERSGTPLPEADFNDERAKELKKKKERVLSLLKTAAHFYVDNLKKPGSEKHIEYILKRNISAKTVGEFGIGASTDFTSLPAFLKSQGFTDSEMVDSGACGSKDGRLYDSLGGRLIIPVIDGFRNVIAFSGRIIEKKDNVGKYVNTKETIVFTKGKTLFNINHLKKAKNSGTIDSVIIVEGHLDVISLSQAGFSNVVASMGTALTKDQARIIKRYADKVFISYDGDFAGQKAAIRGLEILKEEGLDVKVVSLPDGFDPDDVVRKLGKDAYAELLKNALPLIDFKLDIIRKTFDLNSADGRRKYAAAAIKVIKESPSAAEQEDLLKKVRDISGFTIDALKRDLYGGQVVASPKEPELTEIAEERADKITAAARVVFSRIFEGRYYALPSDIEDLTFDSIIHTQIKEYIKESAKAGAIKFSGLYEYLGAEGEAEVSAIARLKAADEINQKDDERYYKDCLKTLKIDMFDKESARLLSAFNDETDSEKRRLLAAELDRIIKEKNKLTK